jgi:transcriptional regulator with XRE-family HTH domain
MARLARLELLPPPVRRSLIKFGRDIAIARRKRRLTVAMMAERLGVTKVTYLRVENGHPGVGLGTYAMALFALGLGTPFADLVDAGTDEEALLLEADRLPKRVRVKTEPRAG